MAKEEKGLTDEEVVSYVCALHRTVIQKINRESTSKENALHCMQVYAGCVVNALTIQSVCDEKGNVDMKRAIAKTNKIMRILNKR